MKIRSLGKWSDMASLRLKLSETENGLKRHYRINAVPQSLVDELEELSRLASSVEERAETFFEKELI